MKKFTEKVHHEEASEVVWIRREESQVLEKEASEKNDSGRSSKIPIVYSKHYGVNFGGLEKLHPFDARKGRNIAKYLKQSDLLTEGNFYEPNEITKAELLKVHTKKYLRSLKWSLIAARIAEIPPLLFVPNAIVQNSYLRPMRFQAAGSILAGKCALEYGWAINLGGGFHHCCSYKGGGFCPYADITLLITRTFEENPLSISNAMIVDLDAHQGNGHERDFMNNRNVYILDIYNSVIYPRDHQAKLAIRCAVELRPRTEDELYMKKLKNSLMRSLQEFTPDFVVYNAGTDILQGDPLGMLSISPEGVTARDEFVFKTFRQLNIPIVMLLSGGYLKASSKVIAESILNLKNKGLLN